MKEFRYLVEAGPNIDPAAVKEVLADLLGVKFEDLDTCVADSFIKSFNFVAPVPFGVSLDVPTRTAIRKTGTDIQYVITGIADEDIETLKEHGYLTVFVGEDPFKKEKKPYKCPCCNDVTYPVDKVRYFYNGEEVTDLETIDRINERITLLEDKVDSFLDYFRLFE